SRTPHTAPLCRYSFNPDPSRYPRTTHSTGATRHFLTIVVRPANSALSAPAGSSIELISVEIKWLGTFSRSNQNALSCVRIRPLSGIPLGITQSNALIRSVATKSSLSPKSYTSRTFPRRTGTPGMRLSSKAGRETMVGIMSQSNEDGVAGVATSRLLYIESAARPAYQTRFLHLLPFL